MMNFTPATIVKLEHIVVDHTLNNDVLDCCVCLEAKPDHVHFKPNCTHTLCESCFFNHQKTSIEYVTCPLCRTLITKPLSVYSSTVKDKVQTRFAELIDVRCKQLDIIVATMKHHLKDLPPMQAYMAGMMTNGTRDLKTNECTLMAVDFRNKLITPDT